MHCKIQALDTLFRIGWHFFRRKTILNLLFFHKVIFALWIHGRKSRNKIKYYCYETVALMRFWSAFIIFTWITGWQKLRGPINGIQKVSNVLKIAKKKGLLWWTLYYTAITVLASRDAIVDNKRALYFRSRFPKQPLYFHSFWEAFSAALFNPTN